MRLSIKHLVIVAVAISAAALVLSACGGGGDGGGGGGATMSSGSGLVSIRERRRDQGPGRRGRSNALQRQGREGADPLHRRVHLVLGPGGRFVEAVEVGVRGPEPGPRRGQAPRRSGPADLQRASAVQLHGGGSRSARRRWLRRRFRRHPFRVVGSHHRRGFRVLGVGPLEQPLPVLTGWSSLILVP